MFKKLAVILTIAFLASASQVHDSGNVSGVIDDLLKTLQEIIDKAITLARQELNAAEQAINETATAIEAEAAKQLKALNDGFVKELDALKEKAKQAAVNIDECLGKDEEDLLNLPTAILKDIVLCVQGLVNQVLGIVTDALSKLQVSSEDVAKIKKEIVDCGTGLTSLTCLAKVTAEIEKDIINLPIEITQIVNGVLNTITSITSKIQICEDDGLDNEKYQGKALLTKITTCINNKIIH